MDLEILFWLVFILAPILSRIFRGNKQKGRPSQAQQGQRRAPEPVEGMPARSRPGREPRPAVASEDSRQLSPFEEALRQIQEALEEGREDARRREEAERRGKEELERRRREAERKRTDLFEQQRTGAVRRTAQEYKPMPALRTADRVGLSSSTPPKPTPATTERVAKSSKFFDEGLEARAAFDEEFHEEVHAHLDTTDLDEPAKVEHRPRKKRTKWQNAFVMGQVLGEPRSKQPWGPDGR